jgi:hypothetical protein
MENGESFCYAPMLLSFVAFIIAILNWQFGMSLRVENFFIMRYALSPRPLNYLFAMLTVVCYVCSVFIHG